MFLCLSEKLLHLLFEDKSSNSNSNNSRVSGNLLSVFDGGRFETFY